METGVTSPMKATKRKLPASRKATNNERQPKVAESPQNRMGQVQLNQPPQASPCCTHWFMLLRDAIANLDGSMDQLLNTVVQLHGSMDQLLNTVAQLQENMDQLQNAVAQLHGNMDLLNAFAQLHGKLESVRRALVTNSVVRKDGILDGVVAPSSSAMTAAPLTPAPVTSVPVTPAPVTPAPVTPVPVTPAPVIPDPVTPAPVTPAPVAPASVTAAPVTLAPVAPSNVTPAHITPDSQNTLPLPCLPTHVRVGPRNVLMEIGCFKKDLVFTEDSCFIPPHVVEAVMTMIQ